MHERCMEGKLGYVRLMALVDKSGLTDAGLSALLRVDQSTVSRLKNNHILKVSKYIRILEAHLGSGAPDELSDEDVARELLELSRRSPQLRETLRSLHRLMRESA